MMLLGTAGTGKSRTVRSCVGTRRARRKIQVDSVPLHQERRSAAEKREAVTNSCLLAAPTGCASFQLKFGAQTIHRAFGVPVGFCGAWSESARQVPQYAKTRYRNLRNRLEQASVFVIDELSMVGRQMLGKIEFKVRDTLGDEPSSFGDEVFFGGRDVVRHRIVQDIVDAYEKASANGPGGAASTNSPGGGRS